MSEPLEGKVIDQGFDHLIVRDVDRENGRAQLESQLNPLKTTWVDLERVTDALDGGA